MSRSLLQTSRREALPAESLAPGMVAAGDLAFSYAHALLGEVGAAIKNCGSPSGGLRRSKRAPVLDLSDAGLWHDRKEGACHVTMVRNRNIAARSTATGCIIP